MLVLPRPALFQRSHQQHCLSGHRGFSEKPGWLGCEDGVPMQVAQLDA